MSELAGEEYEVEVHKSFDYDIGDEDYSRTLMYDRLKIIYEVVAGKPAT